ERRPALRNRSSTIFTPDLNPVSYGVTAIRPESARRRRNSSAFAATSMSPAADGAMFHTAGPACTAIPRFSALSSTRFFLPAMVQFEPECDTEISGDPISAAERGWQRAAPAQARTVATNTDFLVLTSAPDERPSPTRRADRGRAVKSFRL